MPRADLLQRQRLPCKTVPLQTGSRTIAAHLLHATGPHLPSQSKSANTTSHTWSDSSTFATVLATCCMVTEGRKRWVSTVQTSPLFSLSEWGLSHSKLQSDLRKQGTLWGQHTVTLVLRTEREEDQTHEGSCGRTVRTCIKATSNVQGHGEGTEPVFNNQNGLGMSQ